MGGHLGVNFFPSTGTSDVAGPPRTKLFLIEVGVIRVGNFNLNLACYVVRPVALDVPVGGEIVSFKCLPFFVLFCITIYWQA